MPKRKHGNAFFLFPKLHLRGEVRVRLFAILIIFTLGASCANRTEKAPIVDAAAIPSHRIQTHVVAPGETVYSIALRYDLDYKKVSQVNRLGASHQISPGQVLDLDVSSYRAPQKVVGASGSGLQRSPSVPVSRSVNQPIRAEKTGSHSVSVGSVKWQWPLNGKVLDVFNPNAGLNKGVDIRGKLGEPVVAAADGEVVYSGSGLRGYGKLLIVKHNDQYLSAYAHNRVLHVAEGDVVKGGERIAEVGFSGTNTAKLHFEIRLDGRPVDPLRYLPNR